MGEKLVNDTTGDDTGHGSWDDLAESDSKQERSVDQEKAAEEPSIKERIDDYVFNFRKLSDDDKKRANDLIYEKLYDSSILELVDLYNELPNEDLIKPFGEKEPESPDSVMHSWMSSVHGVINEKIEALSAKERESVARQFTDKIGQMQSRMGTLSLEMTHRRLRPQKEISEWQIEKKLNKEYRDRYYERERLERSVSNYNAFSSRLERR